MTAHFKEEQPVMSQPSFIDKFSQEFSLEPSRTALLIIDMQNATGNREMGLGKLLAEQGNIESAQYRFDRIENLLIPNTQRLIAGSGTRARTSSGSPMAPMQQMPAMRLATSLRSSRQQITSPANRSTRSSTR